MQQPDTFVTATEARRLMFVSDGKLTNMLKRGEIAWYPDPRNRNAKLIKKSDIDAWLEKAPPPRPRKKREKQPNGEQ